MTTVDETRLGHLRTFYAVLDELAAAVGGPHTLASSNGRSAWPRRGIYFFFESGETRTHSGQGARVVRVGTHALIARSRSTLWRRLSQHRGQAKSGGGNHRGSIFRLIVGASLIERKSYSFPAWGQGSSAPSAVRAGELALEQEVSMVIGAMPFLWLAVADEPAPESARGFIERNAIALLSNYGKAPLDPPSVGGLGFSLFRRFPLRINRLQQTPTAPVYHQCAADPKRSRTRRPAPRLHSLHTSDLASTVSAISVATSFIPFRPVPTRW